MKRLTDRQKQVLEFIQAHLDAEGVPPSIREIGDAMGIDSTNGVSDHLRALQRKGYIERTGSKARSMRLLKPLRPEVCVRLVGRDASRVEEILAGLDFEVRDEVLRQALMRGLDAMKGPFARGPKPQVSTEGVG